MSEPTFAPSPKRLLEARRRGIVAQSRAANALAAVLAGSAAAVLSRARIGAAFRTLLADALDPNAGVSMATALGRAASVTIDLVTPIATASFGAAVLVGAVQTRFLFAPAAALPDPDRANAAARLGALFGARSFGETVWSFARGLVVIAAGILGGRDAFRTLAPLAGARPGDLGHAIFTVLGGAIVAALSGAALVAIADIVVQHVLHWRSLRMRREEVEREARSEYGDPHTRRIRMERARELLEAVQPGWASRARIVVAAWTEHAVAIGWNDAERAPRVLARGTGIAARALLMEAAREALPVCDDAPLANALGALPIGSEVPDAAFRALAAHVNRAGVA